MKRTFYLIIYPLLLISLVTCVGRRQVAVQEETFPAIEVPRTLMGEPAMEYLMAHYWDNVDLSDTAMLAKPWFPEAMGDWLKIIDGVSDSFAQQSVNIMLDRAFKTPAVYERMLEVLDTYLYEITSPYRNERLYNFVLLWQIDNPSIEEIYKLRPRELYRMAQKNSVGTPAADIKYNTAEDVKFSLYMIEADYTIVFFYNLGCEMCRDLRLQMLEYIDARADIAAAIANGRVKILALYPDRERESWEKYRADIPAGWINAYDPTGIIKEQEIYELRAIPSVYVLDREKRVLVKDAFDVESIFGAIR